MVKDQPRISLLSGEVPKDHGIKPRVHPELHPCMGNYWNVLISPYCIVLVHISHECDVNFDVEISYALCMIVRTWSCTLHTATLHGYYTDINHQIDTQMRTVHDYIYIYECACIRTKFMDLHSFQIECFISFPSALT